jgi:hypothetical protein
MTTEGQSPDVTAQAKGAAGELALRSGPGRWVLAVTVLGSGMAFLDGTVVNVPLPTIGRDLDASTASLQWILNGYAFSVHAVG